MWESVAAPRRGGWGGGCEEQVLAGTDLPELAGIDFKQPWIDRRLAPGLTIGYGDNTFLHAIVRSCRASRPVYAIAGLLQASEPIAATARGVGGPRVRSW
jgi:hypothetical protein